MRVNGSVVDTLPAFVVPGEDSIVVDGRPIGKPERKLYVMLNKPTRVLTASSDEPEADRRTVVDLVEHPSGARLFSVGRLDYEATGLVLLTNDGELAHKLTHASFGVERVYMATVPAGVPEEAIRELGRGIFVFDETRRSDRDAASSTPGRKVRLDVRVVGVNDGKATLEVRAPGGREARIREALTAAGLAVKKLQRVSIGPLVLKGLPLGGWRELDRVELRKLRSAVRMGVEKPVKRTPAAQTPKKVAAPPREIVVTNDPTDEPGGGAAQGADPSASRKGPRRIMPPKRGTPGR